MTLTDGLADYHLGPLAGLRQTSAWRGAKSLTLTQWDYQFENFFHPFVGQLLKKLNDTDIPGMLSPEFLAGLTPTTPDPNYTPANSLFVKTTLNPLSIDVSLPGGPYAVYNWELTYHIPVAIAVHLSNNQRFAEAEKWFHLVFDPTNAQGDYWRSYPLNSLSQPAGGVAATTPKSLSELLVLLSTPDSQLTAADVKTKILITTGYQAIIDDPFKPFVVARTRPSSFQWYVVMKYLDNLIAWGDSLFLQDSVETLNEATLCYVLAARLLGQRPQVMPRPGATTVRNFLQLEQAGLDAMSNALVDLESQFPFNTLVTGTGSGADQTGALFGIGRSLYFCIPENQKLLAYWETVSDRLFKIRNSENIEGMYQQLPLFDPPLDPGMLIKAAAAGIDVSAIVSGANQPVGLLRSLPMIQKALELASEVRAMGGALLSALEKWDAEKLALLRQTNEVQLQELSQNVRFLQWKHAQETTNSLLASRASAVERYKYYLRLMGQTPDPTAVPPTLTPDRTELTETNWDDTYQTLVGEYEQDVATMAYGPLPLAQGASPSAQSGASGVGQLYLNLMEAAEIGVLLPGASALQLAASVINTTAAALNAIPSVNIDVQFWGLGATSEIFSGRELAEDVRIASDVMQITAAQLRDGAVMASKTAGYQRRADEWTLQTNLAARELMTLGTQILTSLIAEQVAYHEFQVAQTQVQQAQAVQDFLKDKFTNADLYGWMQSQLSGLYYQYYRFACDTARRAELTVKRELMRPELDQTQFVQYNYWDAGHKGLLSGEALLLDLKRLEMAYHDANKRELEMTVHVSLRQLDPVALVTLRVTGQCRINIPEWFYDLRQTPGHYMRRIKSVALSIPAVVGPYTGVSATLTLQSSSIRTSSQLTNGVYARGGQDDPRFADSFGSTDMIVTSSGSNDSGLFETNLRDERFLPFEGAGAVSVWSLSLPTGLRVFDYNTIADVILHIRYTARPGGDEFTSQVTKELTSRLSMAAQSSQALILCLKYDFPTEWAAFVNGAGNFQATLQRFFFPYVAQSVPVNPSTQAITYLTVSALTLYSAGANGQLTVRSVDLTGQAVQPTTLAPAGAGMAISIPTDGTVLTQHTAQLVYMVIKYTFGATAPQP
ncbi:MAG TPA: hypothetical protein VGU46_12640 [Acidobacteriaceae bacterium]|nr:hypothetical protein [Acidobacteriaceae bacterium]